jgi:hypothetical protein
MHLRYPVRKLHKFRFQYGPWHIWFDPPPIPTWAQYQYSFYHDDYDGAPDGNDNRHGNAASFEEAIALINELEDEADDT